MITDALGALQYILVDHTGSSQLVAAATGERVRVLGFPVVAGNSGATFRLRTNGAGGSAITGQIILAANQPLPWPPHGLGYCEGADGANLYLEITAGSLHGTLVYQQIK